jgi:hypothetical protein
VADFALRVPTFRRHRRVRLARQLSPIADVTSRARSCSHSLPGFQAVAGMQKSRIASLPPGAVLQVGMIDAAH